MTASRSWAAAMVGLLVLVSGCEAPTDEEAPLNLVLISIDTLRADRLGCYGYERDTSPALDRFARDAVVFRDVVAPSPWTIPSHVSLLTGLHPVSHGVELPTQIASDEVTMLAERLMRSGHYTFAITDGGWLSEERGFRRGFLAFHDEDQTFEKTLEEAAAYVRHRTPRGPWFGFLHTYDVHCPYDPEEPFLSMFETPDREEFPATGLCGNPYLNEMSLNEAQASYLSDRYDGSVREADIALESFFAYLDEHDILENTVVVITSDHGEEFLEHGRIGHEESVYRELLQVPLIIRAPGIVPAVIEDPVELVDVVPTLLDLLGAELPPDLDGRSLAPLLRGEVDASAEPRARLSTLRWKRNLDSWITPDAHLIIDRDGDTASLFDLAADPGEATDRGSAEPGHADALRRELQEMLDRLDTGRRAAVERPQTAEELQELRRLGYVGGE